MTYSIDITKTISTKLVITGPFARAITQRVTKIITSNIWQTPRHFKNDARNPAEVLLSFNRNIR